MASTPVDPEKGKGALTFSQTPTTSPSPQGRHQQPHLVAMRAREKIRHFLHPSGKRIHIAVSPEEAVKLRQRLQAIHQEDEFDVYISGTPEHLDAVRAAQAHHEARREELRQTHGQVFDRFAEVHAELDMLANELDRVTTNGVSLDAHFTKFGYNARIRSYDEDENSGRSGSTTPRSSIDKGSSSGGDDESIGEYVTPLKLWKMPVVRQYFHKGIIWRGSKSEEVQSFELFVDLLYVGILQINGDAASEGANGEALLRFVITFALSWKIWNDNSLIVSWFETDDIVQRICVLFILTCLFGYTTNLSEAFEGTDPTLIGFYLASRLFMALYLGVMAIIVPMVRAVMIFQVVCALIGCALWIVSIHVAYPIQLVVIFVAIFADLNFQSGYICFVVLGGKLGGGFKAWVDRAFEFVPAINIEHRTERMNAFVTLVFGYTVVALLYQSTINGVDAFFGKAILGLIQCFCFNWLYFEIDGTNLRLHAIRRAALTSVTWNMIHLPFIMSFVLAGGALSRLVVAHDTRGSSIEHLTEAYHDKSEAEVSSAIRWFYCAGMGVALLCMGIISICHIHKEIPTLRLKKRFRLVGRFAVAIVLICLPLADSLNSLSLISVVTGLLVFTLGSELWAASCCMQPICSRAKPCQYFGQCGKSKMESLVKDGREVDMEELSEKKDGRRGHLVGP